MTISKLEDRKVHRILITPGDPAGIGPDITAMIAQNHFPNAELIALCDRHLLAERAKQLKLPLTLDENIDFSLPAYAPHFARKLKILHVELEENCQPGKPSPKHAPYVLKCLEKAAQLCLEKKADALVTGPVNKSIMNEAGIEFTGHTEFLAKFCHVKNFIMLFVVDNQLGKQINVALLTTHLSLSQVPKAITVEKLENTLKLLHAELQNRFNIIKPKIYVTGLNPHAGESGHLGCEEIEIISPVIQKLRAANMDVTGPYAADTIFTEKYLRQADVVLAMYHDQALPVVKYLGFGHAVNMTLGLPIIRTSVDHGTAFDAAGTHQADPGSLKAAIELAIQLSERSRIGSGHLFVTNQE